MKSQPSSRPSAVERDVAVGAIRWDAWHGEAGLNSADRNTGTMDGIKLTPGMAVERSLGPEHWHYRLPFYAEVVGAGRVQARGDNQEVIDKEIEYAAAGGLDYWAFGYYHPLGSPMSSCLPLYLKSRLRDQIGFCLWLAQLGSVEDWPQTAAIIAGLMREPNYQQVAGGRPLVYVHSSNEKMFGSVESGRRVLATLRDAAARAGLELPYLVSMTWWELGHRALFEAGEFDAVGAYALCGEGKDRQPYAALAAATEHKWDMWAANGWKTVPLVMSGWDRRPRQENPVPWESGEWTKSTLYYDPPRPEELAAHIGRAVEWTKAHPESAEARAVLIYAWNEFDEGGWLAPTLSEGPARLEAIGRVLRAIRSRNRL